MTAQEDFPYELFNQHESNEFVIVDSAEESVQAQSVRNKNPDSIIVTGPETPPLDADIGECVPNNWAHNERDVIHTA